MINFESLKLELSANPKVWLITGVAGFVGSNLLEALLKLNQRVIGLDNFSTGYQSNLDEVRKLVNSVQWKNFYFINGNICDLQTCREAFELPMRSTLGISESIQIDFVLHQAALGSVPRSIEDPIATNLNNVSGFLNMLVAARDAKVKRFVYAASSSTYGDHPGLPKVEERIGKPLSPYAVTKLVNEIYADVFAQTYGLNVIGLRYFNIFGPRQNHNGTYAAVIPKWANAILKNEDVYINGDGMTSRDFCFVENAVQANLLAATTTNQKAFNEVYNVALGDNTSLNDLIYMIKDTLSLLGVKTNSQIKYRDFRPGDVRHSQADIGKARSLLGYSPKVRIAEGIRCSMPWYIDNVL